MRIVGVKHDQKGEIAGYKLDDGQYITKEAGIKMTEEGQIEDVIIGVSKNGEQFLRARPDGDRENNLDGMSEIG